jgi:hypothetical protein
VARGMKTQDGKRGKLQHRPLFVSKTHIVTEEATNVLPIEHCFLRCYNAAWPFRGLPSSKRAAPTTAMHSADSSTTKLYFPPSTYVRICDSTAEIRICINSASQHARRHISWKTQKWWWNMGRTRRNTFLHLLLNGIEQRF